MKQKSRIYSGTRNTRIHMAEFFIDKLCFPPKDAIDKNISYSKMFPPQGCFIELPTVRGCFWTVKISLQALARYVDFKGMIDAATVQRIYTYAMKNHVNISARTIETWLEEKAPSSCFEHKKFCAAIKKEVNHKILIDYYVKRRTDFTSFLTRAVKRKSALEVALNL